MGYFIRSEGDLQLPQNLSNLSNKLKLVTSVPETMLTVYGFIHLHKRLLDQQIYSPAVSYEYLNQYLTFSYKHKKFLFENLLGLMVILIFDILMVFCCFETEMNGSFYK